MKRIFIAVSVVLMISLGAIWLFSENTLSIERGNLWKDMGTYIQAITGKYVVIGNSTATMTTTNEDGDLYIQKDLEVDGVLRAHNEITTVNFTATNWVDLPSKTEAELKAINPLVARRIMYDSTNKAVVVSTGANVGAWGRIDDGTQLPTGW